MKKILFILSLLIVVGLLFFFLIGTKGAQFSTMEETGAAFTPPPESVSTFVAEKQTWAQSLTAVGSIAPTQGVNLEAEAEGVVKKINFENGQSVKKGELLVQLDVAVEQAQLKAAEASARLAKVELERTKRLRQSGNLPQSDLDRALADFDRSGAEVENLKAIIARKTIRAPFSGKVGIRQINLGQYLAQGTPIVSLQSSEQVFVDFSLPQQALAKLKSGIILQLSSDVYPEKSFEGTITAISPEVDAATRSINVQGTIDNKDGFLRPGLFVSVSIKLPTSDEVLVVPATAILYAPYGNSIYIIETTTEETTGANKSIAAQHFVRTGERRGDFVSITEGLQPGDEVVTAGAFKLRNGISVKVNNEIAPTPEINPKPGNS